MFSIPAEEKHIQIKAHIDDNIPETLLFDEQRLRQVLLNLVSNALKFTQRGSITVSASYDTHTAMLQMNVKDTGIGIKPEDQAKLFSLFGKLDNSAGVNKMGIGLGLYICKQIVKECGGDIYYDADNHIGASFIFNLHCLTQEIQNESNDDSQMIVSHIDIKISENLLQDFKIADSYNN